MDIYSRLHELTNIIQSLPTKIHQLCLVVGKSNAGKTALMQQMRSHIGNSDCTDVINLSLCLSEVLLEIPKNDMSMALKPLLTDLLGEFSSQQVLLLDNNEILFDESLKTNSLELLKQLSRSRIIVATWNGAIEGNNLVYAQPGHAEYRLAPIDGLQIVDLNDKTRQGIYEIQ